MEFKRGKSPKESLNLGGYSFESLRVGAILKAKKRFVTKWSTVEEDNYLLVTGIVDFGKEKGIEFIKTFSKEICQDWKKILFDSPVSFSSAHYFTTKRKFNYRLEIIEK